MSKGSLSPTLDSCRLCMHFDLQNLKTPAFLHLVPYKKGGLLRVPFRKFKFVVWYRLELFYLKYKITTIKAVAVAVEIE